MAETIANTVFTQLTSPAAQQGPKSNSCKMETAIFAHLAACALPHGPSCAQRLWVTVSARFPASCAQRVGQGCAKHAIGDKVCNLSDKAWAHDKAWAREQGLGPMTFSSVKGLGP